MTNESEYLRTRQYADGKNLRARIELHKQFGTNPYNWFRWVFDHLSSIVNKRVLELGCGPGVLWKENQDRMQQARQVVLTDFSLGMVNEARRELQDEVEAIQFSQVNALEIPFRNEIFDAVFANHMLYHVPDIDKAIGEIRRVLKPEGVFLAATNGRQHMDELFKVGSRLVPQMAEKHSMNFSVQSFSLENGAEQIQKHFKQVALDEFDDSLEITSADLFIDYILSIVDSSDYKITADQILNFKSYLNQMIVKNGAIKVTKSQGIFSARI